VGHAGRRPFRFGVINETVGEPAAWADRVRRAEALGYATFLIRDHLLPDFFGDQLAPLPALMAAACLSSRLRVGTLVIDNDFRHPALLAKEVATIDRLSGGRFELGIGAGWLEREYAVAGIPYDRAGVRIDRLEESIRVLKGLFGDGPVDVRGAHYNVAGLEGFPKPAQRPGPPLLIGGGGKRVLSLAGREADIVGVLTSSVATGVVEDDPRRKSSGVVAEQIGWVRAAAGPRFPTIELNLVPTIVVTDDRAGAIERLLRERGWAAAGATPEQVADMPSVLVGSPHEIVAQARRWREALGFSYLVVADTQMEEVAPVVALLAGT
jgi:probable F420-dependent oxidoreductase